MDLIIIKMNDIINDDDNDGHNNTFLMKNFSSNSTYDTVGKEISQ